MSDKWHIRFLALADSIATWSKDPSRGVGCVIVNPAKQICATGFNGLPRGIEDLPERLERPAKYDLICHAEMNAIVQCAFSGTACSGTTLYASFSPCSHCAIAIVQAGISRVVTWKEETIDPQWAASLSGAIEMFSEAGIDYVALPRPKTGDVKTEKK
jgi:dCMP deaminase